MRKKAKAPTRTAPNANDSTKRCVSINRSLPPNYLKEEFRQFWNQSRLVAATRFLDDWCRRADASKLSVLLTMASTFVMHRKGLLNYHRCAISTGRLEGLNNKIKTLQRQAYGYRDHEFFELRIYAIHLAKYALVG